MLAGIAGEAAIEALRRYTPGCEGMRLRNFGMSIGIRDTRKIDAVYNMTEADARGQGRFGDTIGIYPEFIDGYGVLILPTTGRYMHIPYRSMLPKGVKNLALGKKISGSDEEPIRFLKNGWQSWSYTGVRELDPAGEREFPSGPDTLEQLDMIARATPRTRVLAGSLAEGRYTYVTRSAIIGFPDFTTVEQQADVVRIHARQRFGSSDLGVNAARVDGWLQALQPR
mgnify:CR=1 FL=1